MNKQTQDYIILKPIAERFNKVASEITDEDIKDIIKSAIREQIDKVDFASPIQDIVDNHFEDDCNIYTIQNLLVESIKNKFK